MAVEVDYFPLPEDTPIVRGDPLAFQFNITRGGAEVDISTWTWRAHVRRSADAPLVMEFAQQVLVPTGGTLPSQLVLSLTSDQTAQLRAGMTFDIEQMTPTHMTWFIAKRLRVTKDISHTPTEP